MGVLRTKIVQSVKAKRNISDAWSRCQALAAEAHGCADASRKKRLLQEAFAAGLNAGEPNRVVSVSAWPLKVLAASADPARLETETQRLLDIIATEPSPVRRADALNLILGAVLTGPRPTFRQVLGPFRQACSTPLLNGKRNQRGESLLARWVPAIHKLDPDLAREVLESIQGPVLRQRAVTGTKDYAALSLEEICGWPHFI